MRNLRIERESHPCFHRHTIKIPCIRVNAFAIELGTFCDALLGTNGLAGFGYPASP